MPGRRRDCLMLALLTRCPQFPALSGWLFWLV